MCWAEILKPTGIPPVAAGPGLRALSALEVERLATLNLVETPTEVPRSQFVEVARIGRLLFRQHPALGRPVRHQGTAMHTASVQH